LPARAAHGLRSMADTAVRAAAMPALKELSQVTGEAAYLALLAGDKVVMMETCDSPHAPCAGSGMRAPMDLHCSAFGKVFLAFGPRACLERVLGARPAGANPADPDHGRGACNRVWPDREAGLRHGR